jgi:hypothetical protein
MEGRGLWWELQRRELQRHEPSSFSVVAAWLRCRTTVRRGSWPDRIHNLMTFYGPLAKIKAQLLEQELELALLCR